ncbi:MAG: DUF2281 domain-containing protein [Candidatus Cloacimonetes bacterium]|nr:DUF2281 domain-containing protein [Candidatus Cloacimonadota bacterium]
MENMNLNIVPDVDLMAKAQIKLHENGFDLNAAFNGFLLKIVNEEISIEELKKIAKPVKLKRPRAESLGIFEGKIWMADDFDEPLEDMKEYME